jgi:hypothetical protein
VRHEWLLYGLRGALVLVDGTIVRFKVVTELAAAVTTRHKVQGSALGGPGSS